MLESPIQKTRETVTVFAEDMVHLFRRADPEITEKGVVCDAGREGAAPGLGTYLTNGALQDSTSE